MKSIALSLFFLVPTLFWAAPRSDEYSINIHVVSSYFVTVPGMGGTAGSAQRLSVLIDGKKYELSALPSKGGLLALGDYKARLVRDEHKTSYESDRNMNWSFPTKHPRSFGSSDKASSSASGISDSPIKMMPQ